MGCWGLGGQGGGRTRNPYLDNGAPVLSLGSQIGSKWSRNGLKMTLKLPKMTSTSSKWLLYQNSGFWVLTRLIWDNFEFGAKHGPEWPQKDQKWPKTVQNGQQWLKRPKTTKIGLFYVTNGPFWFLMCCWVTFFHSRGRNRPKIRFCHHENFVITKGDQKFTASYMTRKAVFAAFLGNLERGFWKNPLNHLYIPKRPYNPKFQNFKHKYGS